jgi:non-specific serine/threonine protein kinase/serine/threonine-protein kinase
MSEDRWLRIEEVFQQAADLPEPERARFLAAACDDRLRREVELLLGNDKSQNDYLVTAISEAISELPDNLLNGEATTTEPEQGDLLDSGLTLGTQTEIGRYRLLQKVGEGGMGEVWLAEQREPVRRRVALKLVKAGMNSPEVIARFESERQALALMDHPAIAKVFDAGSTPQGAPYFVMEYVAGVPITAYCDTHRLSTRGRLELIIHACEGVQHAHQKAIIHRDLKPSNILVSEMDGRPSPKIIDFGVAKALAHKLTANTIFTRMGALIGTPEYMSPEQASSSEDIDTRTDVYSLGIILYELLAGVPPIDPRKITFEEFLRRLREEDPPKPSTKIRTQDPETSSELARKRQTEPPALAKQIRGDLDSIALKALEKDRSRRYGSPSELAADIRRYLAGLPIAARKQTLGYRSRKFIARHKVVTGAAALVAFSLLGGMGATLWEAHIARQERGRAERRFKDTRELADSLIFELHDAIKDLPGSTAARKLVVDRALRYLDRLAQEAQAEPGFESDLAAGYEKLGDVQGNPDYANLGDTIGALASFQKALSIRQSLAAAEPASFALQRARGADVARVSACLTALGRPTEAVDIYRRELPWAEKYAEEHKEVTVQDWLAGTYYVMGDALLATGRLDEALDYAQRSVAIREAVPQEGTLQNTQIRTRLAGSYGLVVQALAGKGQLRQAIQVQRKAIATIDELAARNPGNATISTFQGSGFSYLGDLLVRDAQEDRALESYRAARQNFESLLTSDPANVLIRRYVGFVYQRIGALMATRNEAAQGLAYLRKALAIFESLPESKSNFVLAGFADTYEGFGLAYEALARQQQAASYYRKSLDIWDAMRVDRGGLHPEDVAKPDRLHRAIERLEKRSDVSKRR